MPEKVLYIIKDLPGISEETSADPFRLNKESKSSTQ